jgi:hypothetical protein
VDLARTIALVWGVVADWGNRVLATRLDQQHALILDAELCAVTLSRDFAIIGSLAVMAQFSFRPMALRRHAFA